MGTWWLESKKDPRWNMSGTGYVGGLVMSNAAKDMIEKMTAIYGEPPDDLTYGCMKD